MKEIILQIFGTGIELFYWAMIIYILSSWVPPLRDSKFGELLARIVEPYLAIFRKFIPPLGMLDISPIVAFIVYKYISGFAFEGLKVILDQFL